MRSSIKFDLANKKFGRLTVMEFSKLNEKGKSVWLCKCDCGNKKEVTRNHLIRGHIVSCGCRREEILNNAGKLTDEQRKLAAIHHRRPPGESSLTKLFNCYINGAKRRILEFNLPFEIFRNLTKQNCHYCDNPPSNKLFLKSKYKDWEQINTYIYNGIDRVNNLEGYNINNCVSACKKCNKGKDTMSKEEFLEWVKQIAIKHKLLDK